MTSININLILQYRRYDGWAYRRHSPGPGFRGIHRCFHTGIHGQVCLSLLRPIQGRARLSPGVRRQKDLSTSECDFINKALLNFAHKYTPYTPLFMYEADKCLNFYVNLDEYIL